MPDQGRIDQYSDAQNYGSEVTFACDQGFYINGDETLTCEGTSATGTWDGSVPTCDGKKPAKGEVGVAFINVNMS